MTDLPWISSKVCAAALDVVPKTLRNYAKQGCPHEKRKGSYVFQELAVKAWMKEKGYTGETGWPKGNKQTGTLASGEPVDPKERKLYWDASLAKTKALKAQGEVMETAEFRRRASSAILQARNGMLALAPKIAPRLFAASSTKELEHELADALRQLCTEFSQGMHLGE